MSELVKEAGLRSAVAKRMGSNPIPSIAERHIRYSLAVRIGLFHSLDPGSTPGIGISALQGHKSVGLFALQTAPENALGHNTHSSVVEYRISNPMTRVRFPLSVEKVR